MHPLEAERRDGDRTWSNPHRGRIVSRRAKISALLIVFLAVPLLAQSDSGELRVRVVDPSGRGIQAQVLLTREIDRTGEQITTGGDGLLDIHPLPYGLYQLQVQKQGFAPAMITLEVRSEVPLTRTLRLRLATITTNMQVTDSEPLIDPQRVSSTMRIGPRQIQERVGSLPGRSVQDLVDSQPGWLYEGNAVLHPRGSEYQTQFVVDGLPLTVNRSPGSGPEIEADDLQSISIYTAGIPAEFGRKLGGVVELNTRPVSAPGLHGRFTAYGGSYHSATSFGELQKVWGANEADVSASGSATSHYLNPVVPENYTNRGTSADVASHFDREVSSADSVSLGVRHEFSHFMIPDELVQERAKQIQNGDDFETMGDFRYQHIFSSESVGTVAAMVSSNGNGLASNQASTPIAAFQQNRFSEAYLRATVSLDRRGHQLKAGFDSDNLFLSENFRYAITDPIQFDSGTPPSLQFAASHQDLEQSAFVEDLIPVGRWTLTAGLRWDHYQLLLNQNAFSPRIALARSLPRLNLVLHASLDRVFQTPSFENILISSSPQIEALNPNFLRLPVQPSRGTFYEGGLTEGFWNRIRLNASIYRRNLRNFADDDQLLNTGVSYPIAFNKAVIYGAESKLELLHMGRFNGFASYSYMVGNVWFPVTGGLFLGNDAASASLQTTGHLPDSQDQRNTLRTRMQFQLASKAWLAAGAEYGSGLPFQYGGTEALALEQYGASVVSRLNFIRGRTLPLLSVNSSFGIDLYARDRIKVKLQADGTNLNDRLNVMDFGGLFSGNAIAPGRSFAIRISTAF